MWGYVGKFGWITPHLSTALTTKGIVQSFFLGVLILQRVDNSLEGLKIAFKEMSYFYA